MRKMIATLFAVAMLGVGMATVPVMAADSPDGLKCPMTTMDGHWIDLADFPDAVNDDCVPLSMGTNQSTTPDACPTPVPATFSGICHNGATSVEYSNGVLV